MPTATFTGFSFDGTFDQSGEFDFDTLSITALEGDILPSDETITVDGIDGFAIDTSKSANLFVDGTDADDFNDLQDILLLTRVALDGDPSVFSDVLIAFRGGNDIRVRRWRGGCSLLFQRRAISGSLDRFCDG
jgi:hypothetical protein